MIILTDLEQIDGRKESCHERSVVHVRLGMDVFLFFLLLTKDLILL